MNEGIRVDERLPVKIHDIVTIDDTGFYFHGEKIEDAGEAHRAFLTAVYGGDAAMDAIRAEERERIAQMVRETWFKLPGDDQESLNYRRGIQEGIRRVADAIRSMK